MGTKVWGGALAAAAGLAVAGAAAAQSADNGPLAALRACRQIEGAEQRLSCYDATVLAIDGEVSRNELVVMNRNEIRATRRSLFGFSLPRIGVFGDGGGSIGGESELVATVASARSLGYGKWQIQLEDGAVWETTDAMSNLDRPERGQTIRIRRGALGSYWMTVGSARGVKGRRTG